MIYQKPCPFCYPWISRNIRERTSRLLRPQSCSRRLITSSCEHPRGFEPPRRERQTKHSLKKEQYNCIHSQLIIWSQQQCYRKLKATPRAHLGLQCHIMTVTSSPRTNYSIMNNSDIQTASSKQYIIPAPTPSPIFICANYAKS